MIIVIVRRVVNLLNTYRGIATYTQVCVYICTDSIFNNKVHALNKFYFLSTPQAKDTLFYLDFFPETIIVVSSFLTNPLFKL